MKYDINTAISIYAKPFNCDEKRLKSYLKKFGRDHELLILTHEIRKIFSGVYDYLESKNNRFSWEELSTLVQDYCQIYYPMLNKSGREGLMQYLSWLCWHEGILKTES